MTRRIETSFLILTQRIEPSLWIWLKKRTFFFDVPTRIEPFLKNFTSRIEFCKKYDTKNWTLSSFFWRNLTQRFDFFLKLRTLLQKYDSKNWFLFFWTLSMELFYKYGLLQEFNPFEPFHMIQRIGPILHDSKNWTFFSARLKELNSFQCHSKKWTFFSNWLKELNLIELLLKELNLLFHDSKNWTIF